MVSVLPLMRVPSECELLVMECDPRVGGDAASGWAKSGLVVRIVRGRKMRTLPGLFDEFAAVLQFPWYFGENADAFDECIEDLGWLPPQAGYVIVVTDPAEVLAEAGGGALRWLVGSLTRACAQWARPVTEGEWWDRPAVPFHVVLQPKGGETAAVMQRWAEAGAMVRPFL